MESPKALPSFTATEFICETATYPFGYTPSATYRYHYHYASQKL